MNSGAEVSRLFAALFLILGVHLTYLPVWLNWRGLSASEISLAMSTPLLVRLGATPLIAFFADRTGSHRGTIAALGLAGLTTMLALSQARGFWTIFALVAIALVAVQTIIPLTDAIAIRTSRTGGPGYGRMRLWGSLAFIAASFLAGFAVEGFGPEVVIWLLVCGTGATLLAALSMHAPVRHGPTGHPNRPALSLGDVAALARDRRFLLFLVASGAIQASHAMFYVFGVLHWRAQGLSATAIGSLWALAVFAEIALFWVSPKIASRFGPIGLLQLGGGAAVLRWTLTGLDPPLVALLPLQLLHALTYAASHLGAMYWLANRVPEGQQGTAQALLNTFTAGVAMSGAMLLAGALYAEFGGASYLSMSGLAAVGVLAAVTLRKESAGKAIVRSG